MNDRDLEDFDPQKFVKGLSPVQLEMMAEFYDEAAASLRLLSRAGRSFKAPTGKDMLRVFQAAGPELVERFAPPLSDEVHVEDDQTSIPKWRNEEEKPKKRVPRNSDSEWRRELGDEIQKLRKGLTLPAVPSFEEIKALFEFTSDNPRNHLIIRVLYASGIRREELVNLRVADIYFQRNILFVRQGKWDKDRYVLIDQETSDLLAEYTRNFLSTDRVFDISTRTVNRVVNEAAEKTGLRQRFKAMERKFTVHTLRHSYATHMHESGADLFLLRTLLGHIHLNVTRTYVHIGVHAFSDRYNKYHPLANGNTLLKGERDFPELQEDD